MPSNSPGGVIADAPNPAATAAVAPQKLPARTKFVWAFGSLADNYAMNALVYLKDPVYVVSLGVPAEVIGWALSVPRAIDAFLDPLVGHASDNHRGRFGRRRPFILGAALPLAVFGFLLWTPPAQWSHQGLAWYFLAVTMAFYAAYSFFSVPYRALGLELTPDYDERTSVQTWAMTVALVGGLTLPWLFKLSLVIGHKLAGPTVANPSAALLTGVAYLSAGIGVILLVTSAIPALFCKEQAPGPTQPLPLFRSLVETAKNRPFRQVMGMNFFAALATMTPGTTMLLVAIHYLLGGDQDRAATLMGYTGSASMIGAIVGLPVNAWISRRVGKHVGAWASLGITGSGFLSFILTLSPAHPYWAIVSYFLLGCGVQGIWLMAATMLADVCDEDELRTGRRREGMYGAVFSLQQKLGYALSVLLGGYVVRFCGYTSDVLPTRKVADNLHDALIWVPLLGLVLAAGMMIRYPLTKERLASIQASLRSRSEPN